MSVAAPASAVRTGGARPQREPRSAWGRYRMLLAYARPYRRGWAAMAALTVASTLSGLLTPLPLMVLIDNVLGHHKPGPLLSLLPGAGSPDTLLLWVAGAELAFFALASALDVLLTMLWIRVGQAMVNDLARDLFARVLRRSVVENQRMPIGETMERVGADSWCVYTVADELVFTPAHVLVTTVAIVVAMASLDAGLTVLVLAIVPPMALASFLLGRRTREASHAQRDVEGQISAHVHQTLTGISVVQAFGREASHERRFEQLARTAIRARMRVALTGSADELSSGLVAAIGTGAVLLLAANAVLEGRLTTGAVIVFAAYMTTLQGQLGGITGIYPKLQAVRASVDRAVDVLDSSHDVRSDPRARALSEVRGEVSCEGVSFAYEPAHPVLEDVSFHV
ncbi:MAG: ABC transporter transmembrane domain-containing protein, partial [Solirubrobacterales bacterium]|nr:ABC transporter transmembrane domain-containing protein [Solirubrobacterales bacterium]